MEFKEHSYGFRPHRNALQAVRQSQKYINTGNQHIVDIDLKSFFDEVDHCLLLQLVYRKVKCPLTLRLVRKWLRAPIQINGELVKRRKGVPQGSSLSPLLSNIMLHELDKEMEKRGLRYVRYADDFSIYTKSQPEARQVGNAIFRRPVNFEILGYKFVPVYKKGVKGQYQLTVSDQSWKSLKRSLKAITKKTTPSPLAKRIAKLKEIQRGCLIISEWEIYRANSRIWTVGFVTGRVASTKVLHLARLEKARTEKEEPDPIGYPIRPGVRLDRTAEAAEPGWGLGSSSESHSWNDDH